MDTSKRKNAVFKKEWSVAWTPSIARAPKSTERASGHMLNHACGWQTITREKDLTSLAFLMAIWIESSDA
jgi:hypothetical protein